MYLMYQILIFMVIYYILKPRSVQVYQQNFYYRQQRIFIERRALKYTTSYHLLISIFYFHPEFLTRNFNMFIHQNIYYIFRNLKFQKLLVLLPKFYNLSPDYLVCPLGLPLTIIYLDNISLALACSKLFHHSLYT